MLDQDMKNQYIIDGGDPTKQVKYSVTFTFKGESDFGDDFQAKGKTYVLLADYDYCQ